MYNNLGQLLKSFDFLSSKNSYNYNIENLSNGIYLIQVFSTNKQFQKAIKL
jgi:hypothetical protein